MLVVLAVALPFVLVTAGIVWQLAANERETRRETILFSARTLMNAVDAMLNKEIAVAQLLATSPALQSGDLMGFRKEAERALPSLSGGRIVLSDQNGQELVNLSRLPGAPLPHRSPAATKLQHRAIETGQVQISDVYTSATLQTPVVSVEVPVKRPGEPSLDIAVVMDSRIFLP